MLSAFFKKLYYRVPLFTQAAWSLQSLHKIEAEMTSMRQELKALRLGLTQTLLEELRRLNASAQGPKSLHRHEAQICSQNGEDGILREIFRRIGAPARTFVEIGLGDGTENNTAFLLSQGWTGYWIDGNPDFVAKLAGSAHAAHVRHHIALIDRENIEPLLRELTVPTDFDLLSLDIDQNTYHVWSALAGFRPRVVVIEYNATIPPDIDWVVAYDAKTQWEGSHNFGASLKAYERLGEKLGYALVHCELTGANAFFVRRDLLADHFCAPYTAEHHYQPPRYSLCVRQGHRTALLDRNSGVPSVSPRKP